MHDRSAGAVRYLAISWCLSACPLLAAAEDTRDDAGPQSVLRLPLPELPDEQAPADHPLRPVIKLATEAYRRVRAEVQDYTCVLVRRERVDGRLRPHEFIFAKVRHRQLAEDRVVVPFSVYLRFLKPVTVRDREVLYVEGANDGEMFARRGGTRFAFVTTRLRPDSELAMRGNRYPITEFGIENMLARLLAVARRDLRKSCRVDLLPDARMNDRPVRGIIVTYQSPQENPDCYQARIFVDTELELPVHFESYAWPEQPDEDPKLIEQYSFTQLKLNRGLTDGDFSEDNPQYRVK